MAITREEVFKVARLSRLDLSENELQMYTVQLGKILDYMEKLKALNVDKTEPLLSAALKGNVFRPDEVSESLPRVDALSSAPDQDGEFFLVPPVIE